MRSAKISDRARRIDLAVIIPSLDKYGGAERFVIECVARWQARHRITLYSTAFSEDLLEEHGIGDAVKRVHLSRHLEGEHATLLNALMLPRLWREEIGQHELYHTHLWPTHLVDLHPMVWYPHEPFRAIYDLRYEQNQGAGGVHVYPKYDYDRLGERHYEATLAAIQASDRSAHPDQIVANSRYSAGYLSRVYDRPVTDIVYPGAEPRTSITLPRDRNLFVTIGQLWAHKRIRLLIEAVAMTDEAQLVVIGAGPDRDWLQNLTQRLGVSDRVFIFSGLSNSELALILARAGGFLFAPIREPFGIAVLEAMAAGVPVIAVDEGGYVEALTPECSFLVPAFPSAFSEKMALLQSDPELGERMGAAGRIAAAGFTWTRSANELEQILVKAAGPPPATEDATADTSRTLFGAQYYLWYGEGFGAAHWNDNPAKGHIEDRPVLGYYGSSKGGSIEFHLGQFERMGLDFVVLNLHIDEHGPNIVEMRAIETFLTILEARRSPLRVAVQIASYSDDLEVIGDVVDGLKRLYFGKPSYLKLDGEPVLFWFWSTAFDRRAELVGELEQMTEGIVNIAASLRLPAGAQERDLTGQLFQGFAPYSPLELAEPARWTKVWSSGYRLAAEAGMRYRVATISPGYDDSGLKDPRRLGNPYRKVPRQDGATYEKSIRWLEGLTTPPHLALVSTFNEFHENTHVEPSLRHGDRYVEMTRALTARVRLKQGGPDA